MTGDLVRLSIVCLGVLALAGCDNSNTLVLTPNPATRLILDDSRCPMVRTCASCVLEYDAFDKNSNPAQFPTIVWTSRDPARATVEQSGRVNGWRPGLVTIHAEVLETGAADSVSVSVTVDPNIPCNPPAALAP